jgi:hypothetical protein
VINMLALRPAYNDSVGRTDRLLRRGSTRCGALLRRTP